MRDDVPAGRLHRAIELLREEPRLQPALRARMLADAPRAAARDRRWVSVPLPVVIAAGFVCLLIGGTVVRFIDRGTQNPAATSRAELLPVRFSVVAPTATRVSIVGDFNHWNPSDLPMRRSADGRAWEVEVRLPLGRYTYAFMIDGRLAPDPQAPRGGDDDFGSPNSVLMVRGS